MDSVSSEKRLSVLPDIPTFTEAGVPGVERPAWFSMFGPGTLPPELAKRIRDDVAAVLAEPETLAKIKDLASEPGGEEPAVFAKRVKEEIVSWRQVAKEAGIEPE